jgi:peptidoglycan-associated lipoprotein
MHPKKRTAAALITLIATVILIAACQKKVAAPPTPPPPPPPPPAAPTVTLNADPTTIDRGQMTTLTWESENATKLDLQPGVGSVAPSGSRQVSPRNSTTYTLTATGPGGTDTATARVTVVIPPPPPPPPPKISDQDLFDQNLKDAYFDLDRFNIRPDAAETLSKNADFLRSRSNIQFTIEGHCDERGSEEYNLGLGDRRANSAKEYLVNLGISEDRIRTISYGESRPTCTASDEACWQQNRRAHPRYGH